MHELGLLDDFLKLPHTKTRELAIRFGDETSSSISRICRSWPLMSR
jgi:hypothetical protein